MYRRRGQSLVEYVALVTIILGVFLAVGNYFKRGVQGRWKEAVDGLGDQYDPRVTVSDYTDRVSGHTEVTITAMTVNAGIWTLRDDASTMVETKDGYIQVGAF